MSIYCRQNTCFTCGPAALIAGMALANKSYAPSDIDEYEIWRESNTVFMGDGHPGCNPFGLALSAHRRGVSPEVVASSPIVLSSWTNNNEERAIAESLILRDYRHCTEVLPVIIREYEVSDLTVWLKEHAAIIMLTWDIEDETAEGHWVLLTHGGVDSVIVHDPWEESPPSTTYSIEDFMPQCRNSGIEHGDMACILLP